MTVQETSGVGAGLDLAPQQTAAPSPPVKTARHLPVQKDWPLWAIVAVQIGILVGAHRALAGGRGPWLDRWVFLVEAERHLRHADQILRRRRCLDRYRLHLPLDDLRLFARHHVRLAARPVVLVVAQLRRHRAALHHLLRVAAEAGAGAAGDPGVRHRARLEGRHRHGADAGGVDAHRLCGREGARSATARSCSTRSAPRAGRFFASWSCRSACPGSFRCCG